MICIRQIAYVQYRESERDHYDDNIKQIKHTINWSDMFVRGSSKYHGSIAGCDKEFFRSLFQGIRRKTFGYFCASHENDLTVIDQMHTAVPQCYGLDVPFGISVNSKPDLDDKG